MGKHGVNRKDDYAYTAKDESCKQDSFGKINVFEEGADLVVQQWSHAVAGSDPKGTIMAALADGPLSTGVTAGTAFFHVSSGGNILTYEDCADDNDKMNNHAIVITGYGSGTCNSASQGDYACDYFIIKNSWGTGWADKGYLKMEAVGGDTRGTCTLYMDVTRPIYKN